MTRNDFAWFVIVMIGFLSPKGLALLKPMAIPLAFLAWTWVCFFSVVAFVAALKH